MPATVDQLEAQVLALGEEDRSDLLSRLLRRLQESFWVEPGTRDAWLDEAERRDGAIEAGHEAEIPGEEVLARVRAALQG